MNRHVIILLLMLLGFQNIIAQDIDDLSFGSDESFDILTWNIEQFPKNGQTTMSYVIDIIEALDVDIIAIQEVNDINIFNQMVNELSSYNGYLESFWFGGLAYIYKADNVEINSFYEIYTTSGFWNYFPRSPMIMDLNYMNQRFIIINNHFKCCGDGVLNISNDNDEETRRYFANNLLKDYIDNNLSNENVIVLGDLNDNLVDDSQNNVFQMILNDSNNYMFTDYDIASGSNSDWSFPSWPSHLDHILITNDLFDEFQDNEAEIQTIKIDDYLPGGWSEYDENISDHRPVALKLSNSSLSSNEYDGPNRMFINYPNPFSTETIFTFKPSSTSSEIEIYDINNRKIKSLKILEGQSSIKLNAQELSNGIYIAHLLSNTVKTTRKIVVMK